MDKAYYREMWEEAREELKLVDEENKDLRAENTRLKAEVELWKLRSDNWQKFCQATKEGNQS